MKRFIFVFLIVFYLFISDNSITIAQSLDAPEQQALQEIRDNFGWTWNLTDPCGVNRLYWVCSADKLHITTLILPGSKTNAGVLPDSLANFKSLTYLGVNRYQISYIRSDYNMYIPESFWSTIGDKVNLTQIVCEHECLISLPSNWGAGFPVSLDTILIQYVNIPIPNSIFSSTVKYLHFFNASTGILPLPELTVTQSPIIKLGFGVDTTIPLSWTGFGNMTALWLYKNTTSAFTFNSFDQFPNLAYLQISNYALNPTQIEFPSSIFTSTTLGQISITGNGFISSNPSLDLTNTKINNFEIERAPSMFKTFTSSAAPYAYIRTNQTVYVNWFAWKNSASSNYSPPLSRFNLYDGSSKLDLSNNNLTGSIPIPANGSFVKYFELNLERNQLTGTVPEEFCNLEYGYLHVADNKLTGPLPDCFACEFDNLYNNFRGNNFSNIIDKGTVPKVINCTNFAVTNVSSNLIPTLGGSVTITGSSFGWTISALRNNVPSPVFITYNKQFYFNVPKGSGVNITYPYSFHEQRQLYNYTFSYMPPNISNALIQSNSFYIQGSNFGESTGIITTRVANKTLSYISVSDSQIRYSTNPLGIPSIVDTIFCVRLNVTGNYVEKVFDFLTGAPTLSKPYPVVLPAGGIATFKGSHLGNDPTLVTLTIDSIPCQLTQQNNGTSITCQVPPGSGSVELSLKIYNYTFTDTFTYGSQNSSSNSTTTSTTSPPTTTGTTTLDPNTTTTGTPTTSTTSTSATTSSAATTTSISDTTTDEPSSASTTRYYSLLMILSSTLLWLLI